MEDCLYKNKCKFYKVKGQCSSGCVRYAEMNALVRQSNLTKKQVNLPKLFPDKKDKRAFKFLALYRNNIVENVKEGKSLYIWSQGCGNGKTTTAVKMMLNYFDKIWAGNGLKPRAKFVNVPQFLLSIHDNFELKSTEFLEEKQFLKEVDLLILDDIGVSNRSNNYDNEQLLSIIDARANEGKATIYTSNIDPNHLHFKLDQRTVSRMMSDCTIVELKGGDRRYDRTTSLK